MSVQHWASAILFAFFAAGTVSAAELRAGVAKVVFPTPAGTHDQLHARVLVLRSPAASLALVACDLHSFSSKRVAAEARSRFGIDLVLLACSGSHSAPTRVADVENTLLEAIAQANSSTFPARLGSANVSVALGYNWRRIDEYGKLTELRPNPQRRPGGPTVNSAAVWRIDDEAGRMRAVLFHAACRSSAPGNEQKEISADYPGVAADRIESDLGGGVVSLFLQGASGNVIPYPGENTGEILGTKVASAARSISPQKHPDPTLQLYRDALHLRERWGARRPVTVEVATVVINRTFALGTTPGAPFIEHQIALSDRSLIPGTLLLGHTFTEDAEWLGVLPTIRGAAEGGRGASGGDTRVEVGAGEAMVDAILANVYRALGKLDDLPRGDLTRETPPEGRKR